MAVKSQIIAVNSIECLHNGVRKSFEPGEVIPSTVDLAGIPASAYRDASDGEAALYHMQNAGASTAPRETMQEPARANGPGGATKEDVNASGASSVAGDRDTVGTSEKGKTTTTDVGAAGGVASTEGSSSADADAASKPKSKAKSRNSDLA